MWWLAHSTTSHVQQQDVGSNGTKAAPPPPPVNVANPRSSAYAQLTELNAEGLKSTQPAAWMPVGLSTVVMRTSSEVSVSPAPPEL